MNSRSPISELFRQSQIRLALTYGSVMGLMLTAGGLLFYHRMEQSHRLATEGELSRMITTLHHVLEPDLGAPGRLSEEMRRELPDLPYPREGPIVETVHDVEQRSETSQLTRFRSQSETYIRLLDDQGHFLGAVGRPPKALGWIPMTIGQGDYSNEHQLYHQLIVRPRAKAMAERYRQVTIALHRPDGQLWGYLQLGQSILSLDQSLTDARWLLLTGLPIASVAIGLAAWWFAGVAIAPLQVAYRQIQQFTADAAHELRTPMAASRTTLDLLLDIAPPEIQGPIGVVLRQQERLGTLVQDLLLLSRLDIQEQMGRRSQSQLTQAHPSDLGTMGQPINLFELLEDLQEELVGLAIAQGLTLSLDAPEVLWIWGDADRLCRLISNLMDNAINHGTTAVTVNLRRREAWAIVEVQDDGPGIALEHQPHVFDRFYRIEGDRFHRKMGTGLGLAIAQAIAQAHRTKIRLVSSLGVGTTFSVALPLWRGDWRGSGSSGLGRSGSGQSDADSQPGLLPG